MKIILISGRHGGSRSIELGRWSRALLSLCCLGLPLGMVAVGYMAGQDSGTRAIGDLALAALQDDLEQQSSELEDLGFVLDLDFFSFFWGPVAFSFFVRSRISFAFIERHFGQVTSFQESTVFRPR